MENFSGPLCKYYTPIGTLTYGLILVVAVALVYKLLEKLKVKIDKQFFYALLPFIVYGGFTRALRDHSIGPYATQAWWWCSPPIYFMIFALALGSLLAGLLIQRYTGVKYWKITASVGSVLLLYNLWLLVSYGGIKNPAGFGITLGLITAWTVLFFAIRRFWPSSRRVLTKTNTGIILAHLLDASSTFTALTFFGFYEQHVVPTLLINIFGPAVMFPLKLVVVIPVLWYVDKSRESEQFRGFLKIIILILGLALGIRDWLTVGLTSV